MGNSLTITPIAEKVACPLGLSRKEIISAVHGWTTEIRHHVSRVALFLSHCH